MSKQARKRTVSPKYNLLPVDEFEDKKTGEGGGYINMDTGSGSHETLAGFNKLLLLTEAVGLALIVMVTTWCGYHRGGFSWRSDPKLEFNLHPLCMVLSMVFLTANSILTYRVLRTTRKSTLKLIHGGLHVLGLPALILGLVAVFDSHNLQNIPNLYSLHSWIGIIAVALFVVQYIIGFVTFLFPGLSGEVRTFALPLHVFSGTAIFILSVAASLLGLNEKAFFVLTGENDYSLFPSEGILINMIGVVMLVFALLVGYLVTKPEYKRMPRPEDGSPLLAAQQQ